MLDACSLPFLAVVAAGAAAAVACASADAQTVAAAPAATPIRQVFAAAMAGAGGSAGDLHGAVRPDRSDAEIAALRAEGPAALGRLLAELDAAAPGPARDALAATVDRVAGQRYATVSRLFWYTELDQARAAAQAQGKPILSLRLLGRLDEDLSCANSRFFRTVLYADATVSALLRSRFVLHWSSERPVPRVTIDYGDGRRLERTVTGNSVHYVLDAEGRPLDALPGMYAPAVFRAQLGRSLELARHVAGLDARARASAVRTWHRERMNETVAAWQKLGTVPVINGRLSLLTQADIDADSLARAQRTAITKAVQEIPTLLGIKIGPDPGKIDDRVEVWASIGQRLFGLGDPVIARGRTFGALGEPPARRPTRPTPIGLLDGSSRALVLSLVDAAPADPRVPRPGAAARDAILARLEQTMVADSAQNEMTLRQVIRSMFASGQGTALEVLNAQIYSVVFATPAEDAWLGLLPRDVYTGLPGDGVVID